MNRFVPVAAALLLLPAAAAAQVGTRMYTRPTLPSPDALDRMHLKMAWRFYVPTDGLRDGIFSVQVMDNQVLVQTLSGSIVALNADDGTQQWRIKPGVAYRVSHKLGHNKTSVFAVRGASLIDIDRQNGRVRWVLDLPDGAGAAPAADDDQVYLCLGTGKLYVYALPEAYKGTEKPTEEKKAELPDDKKTDKTKADEGREAIKTTAVKGAAPSREQKSSRSTGQGAVGLYAGDRRKLYLTHIGPQPPLAWDYKVTTRLEQQPMLTDERVVLAGADGVFLSLSKVHDQAPYRFETGAGLSAPLGHYAVLGEDNHLIELAYIASRDFNLYAVDTVRGRVDWRFTAAAPLRHQPNVTDEDIYLVAEGEGLYRINRLTGEQLWHNPAARRFLSMNKKFVYAADRYGRLLVLDRARGTLKGTLDTSGFVVPISNEWTDRTLLASHDGLLICLHDRDYPAALQTKTTPVRKTPAQKAEDKAEDKGAEKPKDDNMEKPADDAKKPAAKPAPKPAKPAAKPAPEKDDGKKKDDDKKDGAKKDDGKKEDK